MKLQKFLVVALVSTLFYAVSAHAQLHYTVTPCPINHPAGINIFGEVTGQVPDPNAPPPEKYHPISGNVAVWLNGKTTNLVTNPTMGYPNVSWGDAINDFGEVVGQYWEQAEPYLARYTCLSVPGRPLEVLNLPPQYEPYYAINNLGHILVSLPTAATELNAAIYRSGVTTYLGNLPGSGAYGSIGYGINDRDQVVGEGLGAGSDNGLDHAFLWQDGRMIDLGTLAGPSGWSVAYAINNQGQVVGSTSTAATWRNFAIVAPCLWQNGVIYNLGFIPSAPGSDQSGEAVAINNLGEIVGTCTINVLATGQSAPSNISVFLYIGGKMYDLSVLSGDTLTGVIGINDFGLILATDTTGTVLLTPVRPWLQGLAVRR
jgi:probable HAF family extracellular repeat protein